MNMSQFDMKFCSTVIPAVIQHYLNAQPLDPNTFFHVSPSPLSLFLFI